MSLYEDLQEAVKKPRREVFTPLSREQRCRFLDDYLEHLQRRDGEIDPLRRRFSVREQFFRDVEENPVRRTGALIVDPFVFARNEERRYPETGLDEATLWALAVAKTNRAERDGVEYALARIDTQKMPREDPYSYILVEEFYHTRILKDALAVLGLEMRDFPPPKTTQLLTHSMYHLPKYVSHMTILCSEIVGVAGFRLLADKAQELFSDQPAPLRRIDELFQQILVDEVGHVHYARSQLGPVRLAITEKMLSTVTQRFFKDIPEFELLFGKERLLKTVNTADVAGAVAQYADRFVPKYE
ncbi:hypothetical protein HY495_01180 [Candidatus Woesearchaeota archaeon]|nr:hypothetical protein [Candidatus Woesearchaeota archaeon]